MRAVLAEFIGTTLFVYVGCGAAVASQSMLGLNPTDTRDNTFLVGTALAFGIAYSVLVYAVGPISGGHLNPAVTMAYLLLGEMHPILAAAYVMVQTFGAILGSALVFGTFASNKLEHLGGTHAPAFRLGMNMVSAGIPVGSAFLGELMGTLLLVFTVLMTAVYRHVSAYALSDDPRQYIYPSVKDWFRSNRLCYYTISFLLLSQNTASNIAPIATGWSVFLAHLVLIPITGCGINPARSLGPMVVNLLAAGERIHINGWWIYYVAPFVGSLLATVLCKYLFGVATDGEGWWGADPTMTDANETKALQEGLTTDDEEMAAEHHG
jgi:glycerol uptake facilitator-like aquaporin